MNASIKNETKEFAPFTLEIGVESPDDLKYLWHLFNEANIEGDDENTVSMPESSPDDYTVYAVLNQKCLELGIREAE